MVTVGDSATALAWGSSGRFRSNNAINAATVCAVLRGQNEINLVDSEQITSEQNRVADIFSRRMVGESWNMLLHRVGRRGLRELGVGEEPLQEIRIRDLEGFLELCNPRLEYDEEGDFGRRVCAFVENMSLEPSL